MKAFVALLAVLGVAQGLITYDDVLEAEFQSFKMDHNRSYKDVYEEQLRTLIFKDNKMMIDKHNKRYAAGEVSYKMGVNQFTDLLSTEFERQMLSSIDRTNSGVGIDYIYNPNENVKIPDSIDWRNKNAVTAVKNQGQCGSCWAFSATGVLESQYFIRTKQLVSLSEQNLVDCSKGDHGCQGGWPSNALKYIQDNGGIDTEESYPYEASNKLCRFNKDHIGSKVVGIAQIPSSDESALAAAVAEKGPISVAVDASKFGAYKGGVFNEPSCQGAVNHAVLVVGYGHDPTGGDFWLVKNSWGADWGEHGYIRMARNKGNQCKIASYAVYPLV